MTVPANQPSMTALVVGGSGMAGSAILRELAGKATVQPLALARRPFTPPSASVRIINADIQDSGGLRQALEGYRVTHLFYAAHIPVTAAMGGKFPINPEAFRRLLRRYAGRREISEAILHKLAALTFTHDPEKRNLAAFRNVLMVLREEPHDLKHVTLVTGTRYYGIQAGPVFNPHWKLPIRETDRRFEVSNWYFDVEDELKASGVAWNILRPTYLVGQNEYSFQNLVLALSCYAQACRRMGVPLLFPGGREIFSRLWEVTSTDLLAKMAWWVASHAGCQENDEDGAASPVVNQSFTAANGDPFTWQELWPRLAQHYDLAWQVPEQAVSAERFILEQVRGRGLPIEEMLVYHLRFIDMAMICNWDVCYSMAKARQAGFHYAVDTLNLFDELWRADADHPVTQAVARQEGSG
tara:strand:- start:674 stop:1906 length:1233 start_codon:yes stop_codon:yes gene_type:complete